MSLMRMMGGVFCCEGRERVIMNETGWDGGYTTFKLRFPNMKGTLQNLKLHLVRYIW